MCVVMHLNYELFALNETVVFQNCYFHIFSGKSQLGERKKIRKVTLTYNEKSGKLEDVKALIHFYAYNMFA